MSSISVWFSLVWLPQTLKTWIEVQLRPMQCWPGTVRPPPRVVRLGLASTVKTLRSKKNKVHPSSKKHACKTRQDKTRQWFPSREVPRVTFATLVMRRVTWARICPHGNTPQSNLIHYDFRKLRNDKISTCAMRIISSPQTSTRAIWVSNHLVTNLVGPNKCWVLRSACWACRMIELHWNHGNEERIH
jgi:hypothetical protein